MDVRQAMLDAAVAEAAEAWLADPRDVAVYGRLVAAVEQRRRHLSGSDRDLDGAGLEHSDGAGLGHSDGAGLGHSDGAGLGPSDQPLHRPVPLGSRPAVRAVGADLEGDPAAVLRRLRGG